jgi:hypothetical protein
MNRFESVSSATVCSKVRGETVSMSRAKPWARSSAIRR